MHGSYCVKQLLTTGADDQTFSAKWITDLEASYRLEQVTFGVGVQNLFDVYPEQVLPVASRRACVTRRPIRTGSTDASSA